MKITPTHRCTALVGLALLSGFGAGGATMHLTQQPEVVTVSEDVPTACTDAARAGFAGLKAWQSVEQYETKAEVLASEVTLSTLAADASLIENALAPIAEHNAKEAEWRGKRDDARAAFETAADECLAKAAAAEAADGR